MAYIFDGKAFALRKEEKLKKAVDAFKSKGIQPKLVSIIVGDDPASRLYVDLKQKAGERVGIKVEIRALNLKTGKEELISTINELNTDSNVSGIMVQLPLPDNFSKEDTEAVIKNISPEKDVDGLRQDSKFIHPTSKAVIQILDYALRKDPSFIVKNLCVVGATGMVGRPLVKKLRRKKYKLWEIDSKTRDFGEVTKNCDVVISATGVADLIKEDDVKIGSILIDVGSPRGDIEKNAYEKASFVSPVPGGVGPVTISCLLENLISTF